MRSTVKLLVVCLVFVSAAAFGEPPKADPPRLAIERAGKAFTDAFGRGDIAPVSAMYAEDAIALPPDGGMLEGRAAIEALWKGFRDMGAKSMAFEVVDVVSSGNLAAETGVATLRVQPAGAGEAAVTVKYVVVWKKKGGTWQLYRDIWNNIPPDAASAASVTPTPAPHH
jgi:ketosteroid isomerase-like protein